MKTMSTLDFEHVSPGQALPSLSKQVTVEQIRQYAEASGDRNPIHLDETFARSAGLPGVIAHGMLTMAFANQMVTDWLGDRSMLKRLQGRFGYRRLERRCDTTHRDQPRRHQSTRRESL